MEHSMSFDASILLRTEATHDALSLVEVTVPAGWDGPPLHHHGFDEAFYVLDGELTFQLGDEVVARGSGELVFAPRDALHTLANLSDGPARYLLVCTPGGFERRFDPDRDGPIAEGRPELETHVVGPTIREHLAGGR
jgi:quercetin dioxygenase-like cupin family protein